ncbi:MAG: hypothetical protein R3302_04880, partial [Sulfurimonadaceae bacterium]|nr:hypothetical protein [Sulfurimonadaceae bacterium]
IAVIERFEQSLSPATEPIAVEFDGKTATRLLKELLENLDSDISAAEETLDKLEAIMPSSGEHEAFLLIASKIESFDIDTAKDLLKKLIDTIQAKEL